MASTRKTADMREVLLNKGFRKDNSHHEMFWLYAADKKTSVRTRLSHGLKEYGAPLLAKMSRQLRLSRADFERFMDCPLTGHAYLELLVAAGEVVLPAVAKAPPEAPPAPRPKRRRK
jgi:hypothetical protein